MQWEIELRRLLDRAVRWLRLGRLSFAYEPSLPGDYRALVSPRCAVRDALRLDSVARSGREAFDLRTPANASRHFLVYSVKPRALDEILPLLQNLGLRVLDQIQFSILLENRRLFIRDFSVAPATASAQALSLCKRRLIEAFDALLSGRMENDALNGLILLSGLDWKKVELFRAYCNYYAQIVKRFERPRVHCALLANCETTALLYR